MLIVLSKLFIVIKCVAVNSVNDCFKVKIKSD